MNRQKPQLFTIHFAGGNCYSFHFLKAALEQSFEVVPLELPGRGKRLGEPLLKEMHAAASDLVKEWRKKRNCTVPFGVYGHSMGALLGFELVKQLKNENPFFLVVTGSAGPGIDRERLRYDLEKTAFIDELKQLGGTPSEVFENPELFAFFEPILRADFELTERYTTKPEEVLDVPVYAVMGSEEQYVDKIANWERYTAKSCQATLMEGDHFFIHDHPQALTALLNRALNETLVR